jgi:hypothetical protein
MDLAVTVTASKARLKSNFFIADSIASWTRGRDIRFALLNSLKIYH